MGAALADFSTQGSSATLRGLLGFHLSCSIYASQKVITNIIFSTCTSHDSALIAFFVLLAQGGNLKCVLKLPTQLPSVSHGAIVFVALPRKHQV